MQQLLQCLRTRQSLACTFPESHRIHLLLDGKVCASGRRGNCWGEGVSCHPGSKLLSHAQKGQPLCSSWVPCLICFLGTLCPSSVPNCATQMTSIPEGYTAICVRKEGLGALMGKRL